MATLLATFEQCLKLHKTSLNGLIIFIVLPPPLPPPPPSDIKLQDPSTDGLTPVLQ
jgi:hypothetical protein